MTTRNGKYKIDIERRLTSLEEKLIALASDVIEIKVNHLGSLQESLDRLEVKMTDVKLKIAYYVGGGAALLVAAQLLIRFWV